jgi:hypothetical protein
MKQCVDDDLRLWKDFVDGLICRCATIKDLLKDACQSVSFDAMWQWRWFSNAAKLTGMTTSMAYRCFKRNRSSSIVTLS